MKKKEEKLQTQVARYLKVQYPNVLFMSSASGLKLNMGQAKVFISHQNPSKGWPDLMIMQPMKKDGKVLAGLFLELKADDVRLFKKDGTLYSNEHLETQDSVHKMLRERGYFTVFSQGFDNTKNLIDWYLNNEDDTRTTTDD
jgi:hypothetical protein